jgi:hypothetical protein
MWDVVMWAATGLLTGGVLKTEDILTTGLGLIIVRNSRMADRRSTGARLKADRRFRIGRRFKAGHRFRAGLRVETKAVLRPAEADTATDSAVRFATQLD